MRRISTLKTYVFAILTAATLSATIEASAQTCNVTIVETFTGSAAGFTSPDGFVYADNQLQLYIPRRVNTTTEASIISRPIQNFAPNDAAVVGFRLEDYTKGAEYKIEVFSASDVTLSNPLGFTNFALVNPNNNSNKNTNICQIINGAGILNGASLVYRFTFRIPDPAGNGNVDVAVSFDNFAIFFPEGASLPVKFKAVNAKKANSSVVVTWDVAEEIDVVKYEIERSVNGKDFSKVGEISASNKASYSFTDFNPVQGVGFYRVRNVDTDGQSKYSSVVRINLNNAVVLKAFPLPAGNQITVEHAISTSPASLSITSLDGKIITTQSVARGASYTVVNTSTLKSGVYLLRLDQGNGSVETLKLVKQ